jgi:hypothetical protein
MRYLVIREKDMQPQILVWDDETQTHLSYIKKQKILHTNVSSAGYVTFNRAQNDFMITWHTPYADEPNEQIDIEDKNLLLSYMRQTYGSDENLKIKMADDFEEKQRKNEEIKKRFFKGGRS